MLRNLLAAVVAAQANAWTFERSSNSVPPSWSPVGPSLSDKMIEFNIYLPQQNLDELDRLFWATSDPTNVMYQEFRSIEEIKAIVSPPPSKVEPILDWLHAAGVKDITNFGDALKVKSSISQAESLFSTQFQDYVHGPTGRITSCHVGKAHVPSNLRHLVEIVFGLSYFPIGKEGRVGHVNKQEKSGVGAYAVVSQSYDSMYKTPNPFTPQSALSSQNVVQFEGETYSREGLAGYSANIAPLTSPTDATTVGPEFDSAATEAQLDVTAQSALGKRITQWFWLEDGTKWMLSFTTEFFNTANVPLVNSISYAWSELDQCGDATSPYDCNTFGVDNNVLVSRTNTEFQKIGLRGVSMLVASGDSGVHGRTDPYCQEPYFIPDFPASSPYVTSVGGTYNPNPTYLPSGGTTPASCSGLGCVGGGVECAVAFNDCFYASGGGFSILTPMPSYQIAAVNQYLKTSTNLPSPSQYNATNRAFPDVAAQGFNVLVYFDTVDAYLVSGTSAASPAFSGIMSLLNDYSLSNTGKPLGFLNPLLYQMAASTPSAFTDITIGDNTCTEGGCNGCQGFYCAAGWDPVTGLGSPNYPVMLNALGDILKNKKHN